MIGKKWLGDKEWIHVGNYCLCLGTVHASLFVCLLYFSQFQYGKFLFMLDQNISNSITLILYQNLSKIMWLCGNILPYRGFIGININIDRIQEILENDKFLEDRFDFTSKNWRSRRAKSSKTLSLSSLHMHLKPLLLILRESFGS